MITEIAHRILWVVVGVASGPIIIYQTFGLSPTNGQLVMTAGAAFLAILALRIWGNANGIK